MHKAREYQFFDFKNFDIHEYEFYEQVENGDLNWCLEKKFLAFAGPHAERQFSPGGYHTLRPEDYIQYFLKKNVTLVVRLNKPYYDAKKFINHGIGHLDLYFLDGSNPTEPILQKFLTKSEETPGAVAVHCKAGLGRTGTCIAAYMMKHYRITAEEVIGWLRIVRPGSVIGPQQHYLKDIQMKMWAEGEVMRAKLTQSSLPMVTTHQSGNMNNHAHGTTTASGKIIAATAQNGARSATKDEETNSLRCSSNSGKYSPINPSTSNNNLYLSGGSSQSSRPNTSGSQNSGSAGSQGSGAHSTPYAPNTPQSSSSLGITRKLSKVHITAAGTAVTSPSSPSMSNTGKPLTPKTSMNNLTASMSSSGKYTTSSSVPTPTTPTREGLRTPPPGSIGYNGSPTANYLRPSSRGHIRPSTSSGKYGGNGDSSGTTTVSSSHSSKTNEEESGGITQGDQLRLRRAQHNLQTTGAYTLQTSSTPMSVNAPSTPTGSSMASKMFGSPASQSSPMSPGNMGTPGSASGTRPKSRLGSLLSSWK